MKEFKNIQDEDFEVLDTSELDALEAWKVSSGCGRSCGGQVLVLNQKISVMK